MSNGNGHHWSKFWWKDWDADEGLKMCCFAAQGLWMRLLCIMHKANPIGHLLVNGRSPNPRQIVALCGGNEKEIRQLLDELEENGVFSRNDDGVIFSRRMVRDAVASDAGREFVARRWNGHDPNGTPNTPPNRVPTERPKRPPKKDPTPEPITKKLEADSEAEEEKEREDKNKSYSSFGDLGSARGIEAVEGPRADPRAVDNLVEIVGRRLSSSCKSPPGQPPRRTPDEQIQAVLKQPSDELSERDPPPDFRKPQPHAPVRTPEEQIAILMAMANEGAPPKVERTRPRLEIVS